MIVCLNFLNTYGEKRRRLKSLVRCDDCGKERILDKYGVLKGNGRDYCKSCASKGERNPMFGKSGELSPVFGKHHKEETKQRISSSQKGEKSCQYGKRGELSHNFGRRHTEEARKKMSLATKREKHPRFGKFGEQNPLWRHDLTKEERENDRHYNSKTNEWRKSVYTRDNYTCQITGSVGGKLVVHHLYNWADYPEERFNVSNGITISKDLHILFHKIFGSRHNTPEQFKKFKLYINSLC